MRMDVGGVVEYLRRDVFFTHRAKAFFELAVSGSRLNGKLDEIDDLRMPEGMQPADLLAGLYQLGKLTLDQYVVCAVTVFQREGCAMDDAKSQVSAVLHSPDFYDQFREDGLNFDNC